MSQYPSGPSHARYLDGRVMSASQPELQLMLLDGAARFGRQAQQLWDAADQRAECDRLVGRVLDIVAELARSVAGSGLEAAKRLEEEYAFVFRQLAAAQVFHDAAALESSLRLIAFHRETWKMACEKNSNAAAAEQTPGSAPTPHFDARRQAPHGPFGDSTAAGPRLSLEA
jgi:flagellar protein FliS